MTTVQAKQAVSGAQFAAPEWPGIRQTLGRGAPTGMRFGIVVSRFNPDYTRALAEAAVAGLTAQGVPPDCIEVVWVPGAYEVTAALEVLAARKQFAALIALGAIIEGETRHARMIDEQVAHALAEIGRRHHLPVIHEVVSVFTPEQARARCTAGRDSRGWYAAEAGVEMALLFRALDDQPS
ncbi:MAG: 6,7-dimethyl-8-ribityllumazine synthase [Candidatus Marinimicrobia bacterium]|nr:6,7-dimethyl-8-ribityllumazine synthase [Candidatus Neomarinimicrobiota bacterium]